jgi:putative ABC transport system substrate-binding protein
MKRRDILWLAASGFLTPICARAEVSGPVPLVAILGSGSSQGWAPLTSAFRLGLGDLGYREGQNLVLSDRWADGRYEQLPALASELTALRPALIAAFTTPAALAAEKATRSIPIVFTTIGNPVELGLVSSLSRPSGNATGITSLNVQIGSKRLELMHELLPAAKGFAFVVNPDNPTTERQVAEMLTAAHLLGVELHVLATHSEADFPGAFAKAKSLRVGGLVIGGDTLFSANSDRLAQLALQHALPAIYQGGTFAAAGGLMDYGGDFAEACRLAGAYAGRILKGEKPGDLPVQQATNVRLALNLKTAKTLGVTVPVSLLGRADDVIE